MNKKLTLAIFFCAIFLQAGAYSLTFMLPKLFAKFGSNEKYVGTMLIFTALATLANVYYVATYPTCLEGSKCLWWGVQLLPLRWLFMA